MDTLTHALSGALLARATVHSHSRLRLRERTFVGLLAGAFPDLDYALFLIAPLNFLNWHRGPTHSLLLLPLWAGLLAVLLTRLTERRYTWRAFYGVCALAIAAHIGGDLLTIYGTKILYPLSDTAFGLNLIFDIDPYIAFIIGLGFLASLPWQPQWATGLTVAALGTYLALQTALHQQTSALGAAYAERQGIKQIAQVYALPQPFSPFTWKVIVAHNKHYWVSYINYLAQKTADNSSEHDFPWSVLAAYRPQDTLRWREHQHFGASKGTQHLARQVWRQDRFAAFRQFATLPALYRIDRNQTGEVCVWFTDLRHNFPILPPSFRYGMCRDTPEAPWQLYRLRYFRKADRQVL